MLLREADAGPCPLRKEARPRLHQLLIEELVEREPATACFRRGGGGGTMDPLQSRPEIGEPETRPARGGLRVVDERKQGVEVLLQERADLPVRQPLGRG